VLCQLGAMVSALVRRGKLALPRSHLSPAALCRRVAGWHRDRPLFGASVAPPPPDRGPLQPFTGPTFWEKGGVVIALWVLSSFSLIGLGLTFRPFASSSVVVLDPLAETCWWPSR